MLDCKNTAEEIRNSGIDIAVIPLGSVEQHGSHLPIGTDCVLAQNFARAIAEKFNALLLPVLPVSTCYEHKGKMGNVWMRPSTYYTMLQDIILCLREQGFRKILLVPGHGGIFITNPAIREINAMYDDILVVKVPLLEAPIEKTVLENKESELHAGESETSFILHFNENLVKKERMAENDCTPDALQSFLDYASVHQLTKNGVWGKPSLATKEKGKKLFELYVGEAVKYVERVFQIAGTDKW